jgi:hypothetical protein
MNGGANMIPRWTRKDLDRVAAAGYGFIHCNNEEETLDLKRRLKANKRPAQEGVIRNRENVDIYFVATKGKKGE